jgi:ribosomal protein L12E/L44/L45/RPP1/RPP2
MNELLDREARGETIPWHLVDEDTGLLKPERKSAEATESFLKLPPPPEPQRYTGQSYSNFGNWRSSCEHYFRNAPNQFQTESKKIAFSKPYVKMDFQKSWQTHEEAELAKDPGFNPTWEQFKDHMLMFLGKLHLRQQTAWNSLIKLRRESLSPLALRIKMESLWEEAGVEKEELRIRSYFGALEPELYKEAFLRYEEEVKTVVDAETRTTRVFEAIGKKPSDPKPEKSDAKPAAKQNSTGNAPILHKKEHTNPKRSGDPLESPNGNKKPRNDKSEDWKKKKRDAQREKDNKERNCYLCHQPGHFANNCPTQSADAQTDPVPDVSSGSGKAIATRK